MMRAGSQVRPPSVVRVNILVPLPPRISKRACRFPDPGGKLPRSQVAYARRGLVGSAVIDSLSLTIPLASSIRMAGAPQLRPPSLDLVTMIRLRLSVPSPNGPSRDMLLA